MKTYQSGCVKLGRLSGVMSLVALVGFQAVAEPAKAPGGSDWPQWRGPSRDGSVGGPAWPTSLGENELKREWQVELGQGYPGPIVSGNRVFTVETQNKKREIVRAFDRESGKALWETTWDGAMKVPFFAAKNGSWVRATPATDGERLLVAGIRDVLVCLDVATGDELWRIDFPKAHGTELPSFGMVCSPLIEDGFAYVQVGEGVAKIEVATGKLVWHEMKGGGGMSGGAFSSPVLAAVGGEEQLIIQARTELAGLSPESGSVLWRQPVKAFRGMNIITPVPYGDAFFTTTYGGRSKLWQVGQGGNKSEVMEAWDNKLQGYMCTPVVVEDHAYFHLRNQRAACVDLQSGEIAWVTDERFGKYWSIVSQGDRLLALDEEGELILFRANPERFDLIDRRKVSDQETWAHLTVVGDQIFVRELSGLSAWSWKGNPQLASVSNTVEK